MEHFEITLIPILMIADYFLTVLGARLYKQTYGKHLVLENYELNPVWQSSIAKDKKIDVRHMFMVVAYTVFFLFLDYYNVADEAIMHVLLGYVIILYCLVNVRHLNNIFVFRYANKHPESLHGQVKISYEMSIKISQLRDIFLVFPLGLIAFFDRSPFALGGVISVIGLWFTHRSWLKRHKRIKQKNRNSNDSL